MPTLQIRDLPKNVYDALSAKARREHRSLAQQAIVELKRMPELKARLRREETLEQIRNRLRSKGSQRLPIAPEDMVRVDRNR
jgi:hypothetical protein